MGVSDWLSEQTGQVAIFDKVGDLVDGVTGKSAQQLARDQMALQNKGLDVYAQTHQPTTSVTNYVKNNTWLIVGIVSGLLIVIGLILYFALRKNP